MERTAAQLDKLEDVLHINGDELLQEAPNGPGGSFGGVAKRNSQIGCKVNHEWRDERAVYAGIVAARVDLERAFMEEPFDRDDEQVVVNRIEVLFPAREEECNRRVEPRVLSELRIHQGLVVVDKNDAPIPPAGVLQRAVAVCEFGVGQLNANEEEEKRELAGVDSFVCVAAVVARECDDDIETCCSRGHDQRHTVGQA